MSATTVPVVAVDPAMARRLRSANRRVHDALSERDRLIVEASAAGGSLREIGELVGMTGPGVMKVLRRMERDPERGES